MYKISCFADEISPEAKEQVQVMQQCNIKYLCLRGVWGTNVLSLTDAQVAEFKKIISDGGIEVATLGSPIGKTNLEDDNDIYIDQCKRAAELCQVFNCDSIRMFSFYYNTDSDPFGKIIERMHKMLEIVKPYNIKLLHENEHAIYGESAANCLKLVETVNNPLFRAIHDPANYVIDGEEPHAALLLLKPYVDEFHIKDYCLSTKAIVPAGQGDGRVLEALQEMKPKDMYVTLEPHLSQGGQFGGFTGAESFVQAYNALKVLVDQVQ